MAVTKISVPKKGKQVTSSHYIEVKKVSDLIVSIAVSESEISNLSLGQEVGVVLTALNDREFEGYVTNIGSTAENGRFTVTVGFDNDGDVRIGMTANVSL